MCRPLADCDPRPLHTNSCLSQNDCQKMAQGLRDCSDNKIKSAVYHAGMVDVRCAGGCVPLARSSMSTLTI